MNAFGSYLFSQGNMLKGWLWVLQSKNTKSLFYDKETSTLFKVCYCFTMVTFVLILRLSKPCTQLHDVRQQRVNIFVAEFFEDAKWYENRSSVPILSQLKTMVEAFRALTNGGTDSVLGSSRYIIFSGGSRISRWGGGGCRAIGGVPTSDAGTFW